MKCEISSPEYTQSLMKLKLIIISLEDELGMGISTFFLLFFPISFISHKNYVYR